MRRALLGVCLLVAAGFAVSAGADLGGGRTADSPTAAAQDARRIDACTTISEPGRYVLTADIENASAGRCIQILASDVALSGRGHRVDGTGAFGTAGLVVGSWGRSVENVTVRNLSVSDWDDGVRLTNVSESELNGVGATRSRIGVVLRSASGNLLADVRATGNAVHGVSLVDDSDRNRLLGVTATENALFGVHLAADASGNRIRNLTARANEYGVAFVGVADNRIVGGSATDNRIAGVWLSSADDNLVADLRLSNRFYGVFLADEASGNELRNNTAEETAVGFRLRNANRNLLVGNVASGGKDGILLIESDRNLVVRNRVVDNRRGVSLLASDDNRLRENEIRGNRRNVVVARGSQNNSISASQSSARRPPIDT